MSKFGDKLINLFEVKKIIALMIITVFCILSVKGDVEKEQFTTSEADENGTIVSSNNKESFFVLDSVTKKIINQLEEKIK